MGPLSLRQEFTRGGSYSSEEVLLRFNEPTEVWGLRVPFETTRAPVGVARPTSHRQPSLTGLLLSKNLRLLSGCIPMVDPNGLVSGRSYVAMIVRALSSGLAEPLPEVPAVTLEIRNSREVDDAGQTVLPSLDKVIWID